MAKRRLNKNLVGFITASGIGLAVIVAAIAAINLSRRDPAEIALKAQQQEEAGDLARAIRLYQSAFSESKDPKYLIEAARVTRDQGELMMMFNFLRMAHTQDPDNVQVLTRLLESNWEVRDYPMGQWSEVLEYAARLVAKKSDDILALSSLAEALEWLRDRVLDDDEQDLLDKALTALNISRSADTNLVDQILDMATALNPTDPKIALVRAKTCLLRMSVRVREAMQSGRNVDLTGIMEETHRQVVGYLQPALEAHPDDVKLRLACAQALAESRHWDECREVLEAGIAIRADDPDLHYELARVYQQDIEQKIREITAEIRKEMEGESVEALRERVNQAVCGVIDQSRVEAGLRHADLAIETEPSLYKAYMRRADLKRLGWIGDGSWIEQPAAREKEVLESYVTALRDTVGLKSIREVFAKARQERLELISAGFDAAYSFYRQAKNDEVRSQSLTYLRLFHQEAQTQFPERSRTALMEGHIAVIDDDMRLAEKAFTNAEEAAELEGASSLGFSRLAKEELSKIYRRADKHGLALDYTNEVLEIYAMQRLAPPSSLYMQRIEILLAMGNPDQALELTDRLILEYPNWPALQTARAQALTNMGRGEQAMRELSEFESDAPQYLFEQGRLAAQNEDYDTAVTMFRKVLETNPEHFPTVERLVRVLLAAERNEEASQLIAERLETVTDERQRRTLQTYELLVSESDPQVRRQKQMEMIGAIEDQYERAYEFYSFWRASDELQNALSYLDQMEQMRPDDPQVLRYQYELALRMQDCPRAEKYAITLGQINDDQVGGALYRGRLQLNCGEPEKALSELRVAEREFPRDSELKILIARALMSVNPARYEEAVQTLDQAIQYDPRSFDAQKLMYACYEVTGRREKGIPHLQAATEIAAERRLKDEYIEAHAQLLEEESNPLAGIETREKLREENPDDVSNLLRLAELYTKDEVDQPDMARQRLLEAVEVAPANTTVARFCVNFFARIKDRETGEQVLQKHLESQSGVGEIVARVLLARLYETLADEEVYLFRRAVEDEDQEAREKHEAAVVELRSLALTTYLQAQERADQGLSDVTDKEQRQARVLSTSELANFYMRLERWEDMVAAYQKVLSVLDPADTTAVQAARLRILAGLRSLKLHGEAHDAITEFRREYPDYIPGMMAEAELLILDNEPSSFEEARDLLTRVLSEEEDNAWSLFMRGRVNILTQRYEEARVDLQRAKSVAPKSFKYEHRLELARLYELMRNYQLAEIELRELVDERADTGRAAELQLISLLRNSDQIERAQEFVNELRTQDPHLAFWPYQLGKLLMERKEYSAAAVELKNAVEKTGYSNPKAIEDWLDALLQSKRYREVISVYEGLLPNLVKRKLSPRLITPPIKAFAATAYVRENRQDVASSLLEQAISEASARNVHELQGVTRTAQLLLGRAEAVAMLRGVLDNADQKGPRAALRITLADFLATSADAEDRNTALEMINDVLINVKAGDQYHFEALMTKALTLEKAEQPEQAVAAYELALSHKTNDLQALNNLAYLLTDRLNRPAEALPYAQVLHRIVPPGQSNVLDTIGWVYFKAGNAAQAQNVFQEARRVDSDNLAARYHLGLVYAARGKNREARGELEELLELIRRMKTEASTEEQRSMLDEYEQKADEALNELPS